MGRVKHHVTSWVYALARNYAGGSNVASTAVRGTRKSTNALLISSSVLNFAYGPREVMAGLEVTNLTRNPRDVDFHHPYTPYEVQEQFMVTVYAVLEAGDGQVGILESPTGTVRFDWKLGEQDVIAY